MQLRSPGDTSHLQLGFWNLTYRGDLGTLQFDKDNYTTATASISVPALFDDDGYGASFPLIPIILGKCESQLTDIRDAALVVQQIDSSGNVLYMGTVGVHFTR